MSQSPTTVKPSIPDDTRIRQQSASNPIHSAWVSANAGSGKTFVLSRRVIRLLLAGNDPGSILCLTFTKAAATEMATRVFQELANWTRFDDEALKAQLLDLGETSVSSRHLRSARCLFAAALETPGGLKVQTIHAFCERLLQQFPFEANVPGHFDVADDATVAELLGEARAKIMHEAMQRPDGSLGRAYVTLVNQAGDEQINTAINALLAKRTLFTDGLAKDSVTAENRLREALGLSPGANLTDLANAIGSGIEGGFGLDALEILKTTLMSEPTASHLKLVARIDATLNAKDSPEQFIDLWLAVFLTTSSAKQPRKSNSFVAKSFQSGHPALFDAICNTLANGAPHVQNQVNALKTLSQTQHLFTLGGAMIELYEQAKARRALLDYDDLIAKTSRLLSRSDAADWVQYKLDRGLSHVLVDEAQDTSPEQWHVIEALTEAFFHDHGSERTGSGRGPRTLFAVGDEKQSIFSFQGAAPGIFDDKRRMLARKARDAGLTFAPITLNLSFRSTDHVLSAVDAVFQDTTLAESIASTEVEPHQAHRANAPGFVEIWPLVETATDTQETDWLTPVDAPSSAKTQLADKIASDVAARISDHGNEPGDFLILLKKRSDMMGLINRALKKMDIPVAGMDRLKLNGHIAVIDLLCLGEVLLLPQNDLALATLLKSPFFGYTDVDLERVAVGRERTLLESLHTSTHSDDAWTVATLSGWLNRVDFEAPYRLFARILNEDGMRASLLGRLGQEASDMIEAFLNEALAYEAKGDDQSLQGFVNWMQRRQDDLKRQMDQPRGEVRIMTAHGAKGLEAKYVYLVDDGSTPTHHGHLPSLLVYNTPHQAPVIFWPPSGKANQPKLARQLLEQAHQNALDEYRRLLYVGMTRAEDGLIICAAAPASGLHEDNWYSAASRGLNAETDTGPWIWTKDWSGPKSNWAEKNTQIPIATPKSDLAETTVLPDWVKRPPPKVPNLLKSVIPSKLELAAEDTNEPTWSERFASLGKPTASHAMLRGSLIHGLLQYLPGLAPEKQHQMAKEWLSQKLPLQAPATMAEDVLSAVQLVLSQPDLSYLFTHHARAEVTVSGRLDTPYGALAIRGQVDRLVRTDTGILIVDFKTNRSVPNCPAEAPPAYVSQMAAYRAVLQQAIPDIDINAALVWTEIPRFDALPVELLDSAQQQIGNV